jgi:hypothetical protein
MVRRSAEAGSGASSGGFFGRARTCLWSLHFLSCELRREALVLKMRIIAGFEVAEILMLATGVLVVAAIVFAI